MCYFDTSFLVPLVLPEATSGPVTGIFEALPPDDLAVSHWTRVERDGGVQGAIQPHAHRGGRHRGAGGARVPVGTRQPLDRERRMTVFRVSRRVTELSLDPASSAEADAVPSAESGSLEDHSNALAYVLGEPGAGKTTAFEMECDADPEGSERVIARDFVELDVASHHEWRGKTLFFEVDRLDGHLLVWATGEVCHAGKRRTAVLARVSGGDGRSGEGWTEPGVARS